MDFIAKKNAHDRLLGVTHLEADRELLKQKAPQHDLLKRGIFNRLQDASSILFALLDLATEEEIVRHRRTLAAVKERAASEAARLKAEAEEVARLQAEEEEAARLKAEEEARLKAEEEERLKAEEEAARLKAEEEARLKAEEEERLKAEEEEAARLQAEEEEAARLKAEEEARLKAEEEEAAEAVAASAPGEKKSSSKSKSTPRSSGDA